MTISGISAIIPSKALNALILEGINHESKPQAAGAGNGQSVHEYRRFGSRLRPARHQVQNAIVGKGVRPGTLGRIAKALNVDPTEIMEKEVQA